MGSISEKFKSLFSFGRKEKDFEKPLEENSTIAQRLVNRNCE
jgi:hypothetical protein